MLHYRDRHGGKVVDIGAGLHYLAAVCVEGERCHMLLWGHHHHQATSTPISLPDQVKRTTESAVMKIENQSGLPKMWEIV